MEDDITIKQCAQPKDTVKISLATDHKVQSDTGANANITSDLSILEDIKWVEPVFCKSAKKGASIEVHAIGKYSIRGTPLKINMYYCPDADNTIVSPTAIVRQNISQFIGYQKYLRIDKSVGHIRLIAREGHQDIHIPIYAVNDLCCHHHSHTIADPTKWQDPGWTRHSYSKSTIRCSKVGIVAPKTSTSRHQGDGATLFMLRRCPAASQECVLAVSFLYVRQIDDKTFWQT